MSAADGAGLLLRVGQIEVWRVEELMLPTSVRWLLPDATRAAVEGARSWLQPHFMNESGYLLQSIHTYVLRTPEQVVLIDTGVGNHKQRGGAIPAFNMLDTPYLERLAAAGVTPEDVDLVLCTHIHGDHVGWDASLVDGAWTPTFPRARHLFAEPEIASAVRAAGTEGATRQLLVDSVQPVIDAGLADRVSVDHQVCAGVRLEPSHGHTPGHVSIRVDSDGQSAVFIGDAMHSPLQCLLPELKPALDREEVPAREARLALLERYADSGTVVFGAHFSPPCGGRVYRDANSYRFEAIS